MLNPLIKFNIILRDKCDGFARLACSCSSADSMNVCLGVGGDVIVDDDVDMRDVKTARSNISGNLKVNVGNYQQGYIKTMELFSGFSRLGNQSCVSTLPLTGFMY